MAGATAILLAAALAPTVPALAAPAETPGVSPPGLDRPVDVPGFDEAAFENPTDQKPAVLWFWDRPQTDAQIDARLESMHQAGFTETVIFRWARGGVPFFDQAWFDRVGHLLSKSEELGMKVWLDNDSQFPSGQAGGLILRGGTVGDKVYQPRPDLAQKALRESGSAVRDGGRDVQLHNLFGGSVSLDNGEVVANAASMPGITLLRDGADWTNYTVSAKFRIVNATAGFMVRSPDQRNGYLVDVRQKDGLVDVWRQRNGAFNPVRLGTTARPGWSSSPNAVHDIKITVDGPNLAVTLDGKAEPALGGLTDFPSGRVGMRVDGTQHWRLDRLDVTSVPGGESLFSSDFSDDADLDLFDTNSKRLQDVVTITARPEAGPGASDIDQVVDVTDEYLSDAGTWTAPAGRWRFEAYTFGPSNGRDRALYIDSMSVEAQQLYLKIVMDEYAERFPEYFGNTLLGFADDEPEIGDYRDSIPAWSPDLGKRLSDNGIDLAQAVAAVYHDDFGAAGDRLRSDYYRSISDQWVDAYMKTKYDWAEAHGVSMISNPLWDEHGPAERLQESGNLLTVHQWAQVPGTDLISNQVDRGYVRNLPREPASVAHQLGRPLVYDELMGAAGWDRTVADVRRWTAMSAVRGINKALFHATFDDNTNAPYPPVFADDNVWWKFLPSLTTWTGRLMEFGRHATAAQTAVVQMQRAAESVQRRDWSSVDRPFLDVEHALEDSQVDFDLVDEGALSGDPADLAHARVTHDGRLEVGAMTYRTVVVPTAPLVSLEAMERLRDFADAGGAVVFAGPAPTQELNGRDAALAAVMTDLNSNQRVVTTDAPAGAGAAVAGLGGAAVTLAAPSTQVRVLRFDQGGSTGYMLLNEGGAPVSTDVTFPDAGVPALWDFDNGDVEEAPAYRIADGATTLPMTLVPNVPVAVTVSSTLRPSAHVTDVVGTGEVEDVEVRNGALVVTVRGDQPGEVELTGVHPVESSVKQTGTATIPDLPSGQALDGAWQMQLGNGSGPVTRPLSSWTDIAPRYSGDAVYTRSFEMNEADLDADWTLDLGNVANAAVVEVNGTVLDELVHAPYTVDLGDALVPGVNTVRITVTNTDANSHGRVRTSGLLGPVSLDPYAVVRSTLTWQGPDHAPRAP